MLSDTSLAEMRARAMRWIEPGGCAPVTRDTALNEEHLALDVVELLEEVERLRDACGHGERICAQLASERDDCRRRMNRYEQQLAQWERIAERDHGKPIPGDARSVLADCARKLGYLVRDYPGDKEARALIERIKGLVSS